MEKFFKYFPKAAQAAVSFQNPKFSPARDRRFDANDYSYKHKKHLHRNFSGPIMSIIPAEARGKSMNYETQEPTSPKISCIGQIKHKNKSIKIPRDSKPHQISKTRPVGPKPEMKRQQSTIKKLFASRRKSDASVENKQSIPDRAPKLSQIRRFASSRDTLVGFDWTTAQVAPIDDGDWYSEDERGCREGDDDVSIPFSAPIGAGAEGGLDLEPRKEINLWKRRTMSQPEPLQLTMARAS